MKTSSKFAPIFFFLMAAINFAMWHRSLQAGVFLFSTLYGGLTVLDVVMNFLYPCEPDCPEHPEHKAAP